MFTSHKIRRALGFDSGEGHSREALEREAAAEIGIFEAADHPPAEAATDSSAAEPSAAEPSAVTETVRPSRARKLSLWAASPRRTRDELEQEAAQELASIGVRPEQP